MKQLTLHAFAKLNLSLTVFPITTNGYHPIDSVMQAISLHDTLHIMLHADHPSGLHLTCSNSTLVHETNILHKIYQALSHQIPGSLHIHLEKKIPMGAGLGGDSSNAAALLTILNQECKWALSINTLREIALPFGSDIPFFIPGEPAQVSGFGETIQPINLPFQYFILILPNIHCDTATVYREFDRIPPGETPQINELAPAAFSAYPLLEEWVQKLEHCGIDPIQLSGSGSTLFIPCGPDISCAQHHQKILQTNYPELRTMQVKSMPFGNQQVN